MTGVGEIAPLDPAVLAVLGDPRLPGTAPGGLLAEALLAGALGLTLGLGLALLLAWGVQRRRPPPPAPPPETAALSPRAAALRRLARDRPEVIAAWGPRLWQRDAPDLAEIEAALRPSPPGPGR